MKHKGGYIKCPLKSHFIIKLHESLMDGVLAYILSFLMRLKRASHFMSESENSSEDFCYIDQF